MSSDHSDLLLVWVRMHCVEIPELCPQITIGPLLHTFVTGSDAHKHLLDGDYVNLCT